MKEFERFRQFVCNVLPEIISMKKVFGSISLCETDSGQISAPNGLVRRTLGSFGNFGLEIQMWESTSALMSKSDNQLVEI